MKRRQRERELVSDRFELDDIFIDYIITQFRDKDVSITDFLALDVDSIWNVHSNFLNKINLEASKNESNEIELASQGILTCSGQKAIRLIIEKLLIYTDELRKMNDDAFEAHLVGEHEKDKAEYDAFILKSGEERDRWSLINTELFAANFKHWSQTTAWEPAEAAALSLGKEPNKVVQALDYLRGPGGSPFRYEYERRLAIIEGAIETGELDAPIKRKQFIAWAEALGISTPPELRGPDEDTNVPNVGVRITSKIAKKYKDYSLESYEQLKSELTQLKADFALYKSSTTRKHETLLQLAFVLAHGGYSYNPCISRTTVISDIKSDANLLGITFDEETIATHLAQAFDLLSKESKLTLREKAEQSNPNSGTLKPKSA